MNGPIYDRRVLRIARRILAGAEMFGKALYHVLGDTSVSVIFTLDADKTDEMTGWMNAMRSKPDELEAIAGRHGMTLVNDAVDPVDVGGDSAMTLSLVFSGNSREDIDKFIREIKTKYHCDPIVKGK